MKYEDAILKLNETDIDELKLKIEKLKDGISDTFDETVGILFSASRKLKFEELYRIVKCKDAVPETFDDICFDNDSLFGKEYLTLCSNPIIPFISDNVKDGEKVCLLTYRKFSETDLTAVMIDGFYYNRSVSEILKKDGLSDRGWDNYIAICEFIHNEFVSKDKNEELLNRIAEMYNSESKTYAFCYYDDAVDYNIIRNDILEDYYCCTSLIYCELVSTESGGEKITIKPLLHNKALISREEKIEYDDFGEVGNFSFEMNDYEE